MTIKSRIRTIPDYPKPGIMFRDITTLLQDPVGFRLSIEGLVAPFVGGAVAERLEAGFVPIRKKGKLPNTTVGRDYQLEYGTDRVEIHEDAILEGEQVLLVDDLIATGGTAMAAIELIEEVGGQVVACAFVVDLPDLGGAQLIRDSGHEVHFLCEFEGD